MKKNVDAKLKLLKDVKYKLCLPAVLTSFLGIFTGAVIGTSNVFPGACIMTASFAGVITGVSGLFYLDRKVDKLESSPVCSEDENVDSDDKFKDECNESNIEDLGVETEQ